MKMMMPETQDLWNDCVHSVTIRPNASAREIRAWLRRNVPKHNSGFYPYILSGNHVRFADPRDATACALKWT